MAQGLSPRDSLQHSPTPPYQPQSKRDKRRNMLSEKLSDMITTFSAHHHDHFYAQLTALQIDINMILRAEPYQHEPLPDTAREIQEQVNAIHEEICKHRPIPDTARKSFDAIVGKNYSAYVQDVNAAMERRDRDLTMLYNNHQQRVDELHQQHSYKTQLAREEHSILLKTLRERLIQNLQNKRRNMLRDKEQLDIADSNALLLNSNQFSILNPSSPSGTQNRKTRHTRGRPGDIEENGAQIQESKRKRKAAFDDNENGSPGPHNRITEGGNATPLADKRARLAYSQFEAPAYSVEKLFSEKELQFTMNRAHVNSATYFRQLRAQGLENNRLHIAVNGINGNNTTNNTLLGANDALNGLAEAASAAPPQAENNTDNAPTTTNAGDDSSTAIIHATRSSQRGAGATLLNNNHTPLSDLASAATPFAGYSINISTTASKSNNQAPPPPPASEAEIASDLAMLQRETRDEALYERLVKLACDKGSLIGLPASKLGGPPAAVTELHERDRDRERDRAFGGVPMSKTNSTISRK